MGNVLKLINFNLANKNGGQIIYCTSIPTYNVLTFSVINTRKDDTMKFQSGSAASTIRFSLSSLLDNEVVSQLKITVPEGWMAHAEPVKSWIEWVLTCKKDTEIAPGQKLDFTIENIVCKNVDPGYFFVKSANIPEYADLSREISLFVSVLNPPVDPAKVNPVPLTAGYTDVVHPIGSQVMPVIKEGKTYNESEAVPIYITYDGDALIKNGFKLLLTNHDDKPIVLNTDGNEGKVPSIHISFLFGDQDYDITTQAQGDRQIHMNIDQAKWDSPAHKDGSPSWKFFPQLPQQIEARQTIGLSIQGIITPVNVPEGSTSLMYVQINRFGTYDDKTFVFQLSKKKAKSRLKFLTTSKPQITIGQNVELSWASELAKRVTITYHDRDNNEIKLDSAATDPQNRINLDGSGFLLPIAPTEERTSFEALCYDEVQSEVKQVANIRVNQRQASINWFRVSQQLVADGTKPKITFTWEVSDAQLLKLIVKDGAKITVTGVSKEMEFDGAKEYTLLAYSYGTEFKDPAEKKIRIFSFKTEPPITLPRLSDQKQEGPVMCLSSNQRLRRVFVQNSSNNTIYEIATDDNRVVREHKGSLFALNAAGTKLAVYNYDPAIGRGLVLYDIDTGAVSKKYVVYNAMNKITRMKFSPDGNRLFLSYKFYSFLENDPLAMEGSPEELYEKATYQTNFTVDAQANTLKLPEKYSLTGVGLNITDIAYNNTSSMLYFSAYDSDVLILANYPAGDPATRAVPLNKRRATMLKRAKLNPKLYVAFEDGSIIVVDTEGNYGCASIQVGSFPSDMLLSADEKTLYIACLKEGTGKVVLVDTGSNMVKGSYEVSSTSCLSLSANEEILFAGNYADRKLTLIDLKHNCIMGSIATGTDNGNPFGLSVVSTVNGYKVFIAKECYPERMPGLTANKSQDVTVLSIQ